MILRNKIFYGWFIVAALFIANILVLGGVRNGFGIFVEIWEKEFYAALEDFKFLPAGRITAGAGTNRKVTLFNCFVMGTIPDDM